MTQLEQLVQQAVNRSTVETFTRHASMVAESWLDELLRDPATKAELTALIRAALKNALASLNTPPPTSPTP